MYRVACTISGLSFLLIAVPVCQGSSRSHNIKYLGVTIDSIDTIVISHNHRDHTGGKKWSDQMTFSLGNEQIDLNVNNVLNLT